MPGTRGPPRRLPPPPPTRPLPLSPRNHPPGMRGGGQAGHPRPPAAHAVPLPPISTGPAVAPAPVMSDSIPRDAWVWSGGDWVDQHPAMAPHGAVGAQALSCDGSLHRLVLLTGEIQTCSVRATSGAAFGPGHAATAGTSSASGMQSDTTVTHFGAPSPMRR